jgi:N-acetylmuramoyl-L-alanine amidase
MFREFFTVLSSFNTSSKTKNYYTLGSFNKTKIISVLLFTVLFFFYLPHIQPVFAQKKSILKKVSVAERSDGKGYVIRFGMTAPADSFVVIQPSDSLIQMAFYKKGLQTDDVKINNQYKEIRDIKLHVIPHGMGIDIHVEKNHYMIASAYPDVNKHDLLVGLTTASKKDLSLLTNGIHKVMWSDLEVPSDSLNTHLQVASLPKKGVNSSEDASYYEMKKKIKFDTVVIDAGHGGKDPGTIGYRHVEEKNIALAVALKLGAYIKKYLPGVKVVFTRDKDDFIPLEERGHIANKAQGDLFISIHCNSSPARSAHGTEIYFLGLHHTKDAYEVMKKENSVVKLENNNDKKSQLSEEQLLIYELANSGYMSNAEKFAEDIDHQFKDRARRHSRGIKQAGFIVLYYASMPAVLVELGFISNPREEKFLHSKYGQTIMASALFRAVRKYKEQIDQSQNISTN